MTNDDRFYIRPDSQPDKYRLITCLGAGGEGEVWTAELPLPPRGRRLVAVKILRDDLIGRDDASWERHANVLRSVTHPGLVRVLEVFTGARKHRARETPAARFRHVVMDLVDGHSLREWLDEHTEATLTARLQTLRTVATALDELHSGAQTLAPIAHGDVKPSNIMMRDDGSTVLVDLGLMRIADGTSVAGATLAYAAPELFRPGAFTSPEADRFAFAATVVHLILGEAPPAVAGRGLDLDETERMLANSPLCARRHALRRQIMAALRAEPAKRPTNLSQWLSTLSDNLSKVTDQRTDHLSVPPPIRRTRWKVLAPTAAGVALLAVVAFYFRPEGQAAIVPSRLPGCSAPADDELLIYASQDKDRLLADLAHTYGARRSDGRCVTIKVEARNSGKIMRQLTGTGSATDGPRPDVWSPASETWFKLTRDLAAPDALPKQADSLFSTPVVLGVPKPMAEALGWPKKAIGWTDLAQLARDPKGWGSHGHPEWGAFRLGKTNPNYSSSGFTATVGAYFAATGRSDELSEADIDNPKNQDFVRDIERSVVHYGDTTLTFLANLRRADDRNAAMSYISAVTLEESSLVAYNLGYPCGAHSSERGCEKKSPPKTPLVAVYPKEGTLFSEHPFVKMPRLSQAKAAVADDFLRFVRSDAAREAIAALGFRTFDGKPTDRLRTENGVTPDITVHRFDRPEAKVLRSILKAWPNLRKPANVLVVIDTSGSMAGQVSPGGPVKLDLVKSAKNALVDADPDLGTDGFSDVDRVGLWRFAESLDGGSVDHEPVVPIAAMTPEQRARLGQGIESLGAGGGTGLFNTIDAAVTELRRTWNPDAINAVVVLSDGKNDTRHGMTRVEDLLPRISPKTQPVRVFTIAYGRQPAGGEPVSDEGDLDDKFGDLLTIAYETEARRYKAYDATAIRDVLIDVISNF
jgi:serine/threonine protein kinase